MAEHVMQHSDSPTWCCKCGTFDIYCGSRDCTGEGTAFDSRVPENFVRMFKGIFGEPAEFPEASK